MRKVSIADITLSNIIGEVNNSLSFKEKIEIARQLQNINVDIIELPEIENLNTDTLLIRTISSFVKDSIISVSTGFSEESFNNALNAVANIKNKRLKISFPVSPAQMEYICHMKAPKILEAISSFVSKAKENCSQVEFCAIDATRAENSFLKQAVITAANSGADVITVCDDDASMMPDEFGNFIADIISSVPDNDNITFGAKCSDKIGLALASSVMAVKNGVSEVKTSAKSSSIPSLDAFGQLMRDCGDSTGIFSKIDYTKLSRTVNQIKWIADGGKNDIVNNSVPIFDKSGYVLCLDDDIDAVKTVVNKIGYDLSEEDLNKVYDEFRRVAEKKNVGTDELDAIVASVAMQVPPTYKLVNYAINSSNVVSSSAHIVIEINGETKEGISIGDGSIDAAFVAIEQIIGRHFELDHFQIQAVTEGKEAVGSALVKLRSNGKLYSGKGISTDIIGAAIRAFISAINKISYEEA